MGATRIRVQTADKNITIIQLIHMTHVYQLISWSKKLHVSKKQTHHNIFLSESGERCAWIKHCLQTKPAQNVLNKICCRFSCERTTGGSVIIMDSHFGQKRHWLMDWSHMDYCEVFNLLFLLSFWWHPFTAEDPLVSKWCNAKFLQLWSDEETNSSTSWMTWAWVTFQ